MRLRGGHRSRQANGGECGGRICLGEGILSQIRDKSVTGLCNMGQETFIHPYIVIGLIILVLWITSRRPGPTINNNPQAHAQVTTNTTIKGEGSGGLGIFAAAIVTVALLGLVAVVGL